MDRLVELIVLNVGLQAGILSSRVFSMFVLEALTLTFFTTPVVVALYPPKYRVRITSVPGKLEHEPASATSDSTMESGKGFMSKPSTDTSDYEEATANESYRNVMKRNNFMFVLDKIEHLSGMMIITQLIRPGSASTSVPLSNSPKSLEYVTSTIMEEDITSSTDPKKEDIVKTAQVQEPTAKAHAPKSPEHRQSLSALRLIELSDRTSAVMKSTILTSSSATDPLLGIFKTFSALNGMSVSRSGVIVRSLEDWSESVIEYAEDQDSQTPAGHGQMVFVNWTPPLAQIVPHTPLGDTHSPGGTGISPGAAATTSIPNPFEGLFKSAETSTGGGGGPAEKPSSSSNITSYFVRSLLSKAHDVDVALVIPPSSHASFPSSPFGLGVSERPHLFLPFIGGPDDRSALEFVGQICSNGWGVRASVVRIVREEVEGTVGSEGGDEHQETIASVFGAQGMTIGSVSPSSVLECRSTIDDLCRQCTLLQGRRPSFNPRQRIT